MMPIHVALCRAQGDNPYLSKLANTCGAGAFYACKWCYLQGATEVASACGRSVERLTAMRHGGYSAEFPTILHTLTEGGNGRWQWVQIDNHSLCTEDGTLNTAGGRLMVSNAAHFQRSALAELCKTEVAQKVALQVQRIEERTGTTGLLLGLLTHCIGYGVFKCAGLTIDMTSR
jgi:hypothetical protein